MIEQLIAAAKEVRKRRPASVSWLASASFDVEIHGDSPEPFQCFKIWTGGQWVQGTTLEDALAQVKVYDALAEKRNELSELKAKVAALEKEIA